MSSSNVITLLIAMELATNGFLTKAKIHAIVDRARGLGLTRDEILAAYDKAVEMIKET